MSNLKYIKENIVITNSKKDILDDVTDKKIGEEEYKKFDIKFSDGANSYGRIIKDVAYIQSIYAPKVNNNTIQPKRGTKTYERVLQELYNKGIKKVTINMQSSDSRIAIKKLIEKGLLDNPRDNTGLSIDEHPTTFDINNKITKETFTDKIMESNLSKIFPKQLNENLQQVSTSKKPIFTSNNNNFVKKLEEALGKKITTSKPDILENSNKTVDRMKQLFEYNVIEGKPFEPLYKETGFIGEEDSIPDTDSEIPVEEVPTLGGDTETVQPDDTIDINTDQTETPDNNLAPKANPLSFEELADKKITVLKDIVTIQKEKIDQIFDYIETLGNEVEKLIYKSEEINVLNDKATQMQSQIDFLTPDTAEESLGKMVRIGNGYTIDEYWKDWLAKNQGKEVIGQIPYYQNGVKTNEPAQVKLSSYSEDQIKTSLGLK